MIRPARSGHAFCSYFLVFSPYIGRQISSLRNQATQVRTGDSASLRRLRSSQQRRDFDGVHYSIHFGIGVKALSARPSTARLGPVGTCVGLEAETTMK
jgi:hypothetical protein